MLPLVPRPTSILDRVALAEALRADDRRSLRELMQSPPRHGALWRARVSRGGKPSRAWAVGRMLGARRWRRVMMSAAWILGVSALVILAFMLLPKRAMDVWVLAIAALFLVITWTMRVEDRRLGAVRWLRVAPVERARRSVGTRSATSAADVDALRQAIDARSQHRRDMPLSRRTRDIAASPTAIRWQNTAMMAWIGVMTLDRMLSNQLLGGWFPLFVLVFFAIVVFNLRRRLSLRCDARQQARACPDCGYDLAGVPSEPNLKAAGITLGPATCPECGVAWPLVPPPTPREVIDGNRSLPQASAAG